LILLLFCMEAKQMRPYINHGSYWGRLGRCLVFGVVGLLTSCSLFLYGCGASYPEYNRPPLIVDYQKLGHDRMPVGYDSKPKSIPRNDKGVPDYTSAQLKARDTGPTYYYVQDPSNPRADKDGYVRVTDAIVDKAANTKASPAQAGGRFKTPTVREGVPSVTAPKAEGVSSNNIGKSATTDTAVGQKNSTGPTKKPTVSKVSITPASAAPHPNATTKPAYLKPAPGSGTPTLTNTEMLYNEGEQAVIPNQKRPGNVGAAKNKSVVVSNAGPMTTAAQRPPANTTGHGPSGNNSGQFTQPVAPQPVAPQPVAPQPVAPQPVVQKKDVPDNEPVSIENAITYLERLVNLSPDNIDAQIALRLLYSSNGDTDKAMRQLADIPSQKQDDSLTLARATVLAAKFWTDPTNPAVANGARGAIRRLSDEISDKADLSISRLKICRPPSPDGSTAIEFGKYVELPKAQLETGLPQTIQVYWELENFKYQQNAQGKYFTRLHADIAVYDAMYNPVIQQLSADVEDAPLFNKRRDFFLRAELNLPQLSAGKYEIVVKMEDKIAGKIALPAHYRFEVKPGHKNTASTDR